MSEQQQQQQTGDAKAAFIAEHMPRVPSVYTNLLGDDPARWPAEARRASLQYRSDFGLPMTAGERVELGMISPGADEPASIPEPPSRESLRQRFDANEKLSPTEQITLGLMESKPARPG